MSKLPRLLPLIAVAIGGVVAVRAVGIAPDLFTGARAWAEEATPSAAAAPATPATPAAAICALTPAQLAQQAGISPAELRIIQSLSARRGELDARDADFATTLPLMVAAEQKLDAQVQALNAVKAEVQTLLGQVGEREKAETDRLVAVYSAMRPREAAAIFATLDDDVRLPVAAAMRPRSLAAVLAQMPAPAARSLTEKLGRRFAAQQMAARAATASAAPAPAPTPAARPVSAPAPAPTSSAPAATVPASATAAGANPPAAAPAASPPVRRAPARPASRPAPRRPAARPASTPPSPPAATAPSGPRAYQSAPGPAAADATSGASPPRQSVQ